MNKMAFQEQMEQMKIIAQLMWERRLTNAFGGNFAVRVDEKSILVTPSLMAEKYHCILTPEIISLVDLDGNIIDGTVKISRETKMHAALLKAFPAIGAVIHSHPLNCMVFAAARLPIPSVTEPTERHGATGLSKIAPACTHEMSMCVLEYFEERREKVEEMPTACVLPRHGVVVTGKSLNNAFAMLEGIETDAYCALHLNNARASMPEYR